jgi:hypothetical protein
MPRTNRHLRLEKKRSLRGSSLGETPWSVRGCYLRSVILPGAYVSRSRSGMPWAVVVGVMASRVENRYLSKSVNSFFISLREAVHRVSTKISQDCPTSDRSER